MTQAGAEQEIRLTAKGRATRSRIVEAAAGLMYERGVAGTSLDDVKAVAGVSSSQLYHYFADKCALVRAVIAFQTEAVLGGQEPYLSRMDSMPALRAWRDAVVNIRRGLHCHGGCRLGSLASELAESDGKARRDLAESFDRWEAGIRAGLRAMHERGELHPDADPEALASAILACAQGGILLSQVHRNTRPLEAALDSMLDHVESKLTARGKRAARAGLRT